MTEIYGICRTNDKCTLLSLNSILMISPDLIINYLYVEKVKYMNCIKTKIILIKIGMF